MRAVLIEPQVTIASLKMEYEWDWSAAEQLLKRTIESSPSSGQAHSWYSMLLAVTGRIQQAVAEERLARQADPLDSVFAASMAWRLYLARNYEEAEREGREWDEWHPRYQGDYIRASIYLQTGRTREAIEELEMGATRTHHQRLLELMFLGHDLGVAGARDEGRKVLAEMQTLAHSRYVPPDYIAMVYEGLGDRNRALEWYEKSVDERSMNIWVLPDQRLDSIRSDPRFKNLMRRMGLHV